jgi:hypothetical protein
MMPVTHMTDIWTDRERETDIRAHGKERERDRETEEQITERNTDRGADR